MTKITYYLEVVSSWCHWAEPAWAELKHRYTGRIEFGWKIAQMPEGAYPVSRNQCEWFYRRSGSIMRSRYMLNSGWFDSDPRLQCLFLRFPKDLSRILGIYPPPQYRNQYQKSNRRGSVSFRRFPASIGLTLQSRSRLAFVLDVMKNRFRMVPYGRYGGIYYLHDTETGLRRSLHTKDKARATELLVAKNEAVREPAFNLQKSRVYLSASDPGVATRTWGDALGALIESKPPESENRARLLRFSKEKALKPILKVVLLETRPEQLLKVLTAGAVSTNSFLRRVQNFCVGMNWLPWPALPAKLWPKVKFKKKRGIKHEEHLKIIARELNLERRAFYELCWYLGGSQSDVANLEAEDTDWSDKTICYDRQKLAGLDETDIKPPLIRFGQRCAAVLRSLPQSGPLFPNVRKGKAKDRANEFRQRCQGLGIKGVSLHSYRYSWAERARKAGYPRRQAEEALGHNSKAVHIAYARRAQVTVASLEDYEEMAAKNGMRVEFAGGENSVLPEARA